MVEAAQTVVKDFVLAGEWTSQKKAMLQITATAVREISGKQRLNCTG